MQRPCFSKLNTGVFTLNFQHLSVCKLSKESKENAVLLQHARQF